jgi:hypothetical protein
VLEPTVLAHVVSQLLGIRLQKECSNIRSTLNFIEKALKVLQGHVANDAFAVRRIR